MGDDPGTTGRCRQRGQLTLGEMLRWAARAPAGEVPIVDGEFFFITALTDDAAAADRAAG